MDRRGEGVVDEVLTLMTYYNKMIHISVHWFEYLLTTVLTSTDFIAADFRITSTVNTSDTLDIGLSC